MKSLLPLLLGLGVLAGAIPAGAQTTARLRPFVGIFGSGDAEMYFLGPSAQVGADFHFSKQWGLSGYAHYFNQIKPPEAGFQSSREHFRCLTGALLLEVRASRRPNRGMFFGAGVAGQQVKYSYDRTSGTYWNEQRTVPAAAIRFGHRFPLLQQHYLTVEINATGPYSHGPAYGSGIELITQLSLGTRLVL